MVERELERRALNAARAVASAHGLACDRAIVVYSGSNVLVHLLPAPVIARVMTGTVVLHDDPRRWLEREVAVLTFLAPSGLAVAPSPMIAAGPHEHDGLWMTLAEWLPDAEPGYPPVDAARLGGALRELHDTLAPFDDDLATFRDLRDDIVRLHGQLRPTQQVDAQTIAGLRARLDDVGEVFDRPLPMQALHGDASLSNLLRVSGRLVFNDFEDTFRGPVQWDVAGYASSLAQRGASPGFVREALDHYGWGDEAELAPFSAVHAVYDEIWRLYDRQRRQVGDVTR